MEIVIGLLIILVIILIVKLNKKQQLDLDNLQNYNRKISSLVEEKASLDSQISSLQNDLYFAKENLTEIKKQVAEAQDKCEYLLTDKMAEINWYVDDQRKTRTFELENELETKKKLFEKLIHDEESKSQETIQTIKEETAVILEDCNAAQEQAKTDTAAAKQRYEALLAPIKQYEMERQQRLFYTIQVPDEYKEDINFLVTEVSQRVQHPDIINKLVWNEYVKPYIEDTYRRVGIEEKSGIYKITNLDNGKAYVGKSTNVKKRLTDHFKSSVGIKTIADQAVHHEIWKTGFWNWTLEVIIYCDKEQLNELEKYYINFFDTVNNGYNKNAGGGG